MNRVWDSLMYIDCELIMQAEMQVSSPLQNAFYCLDQASHWSTHHFLPHFYWCVGKRGHSGSHNFTVILDFFSGLFLVTRPWHLQSVAVSQCDTGPLLVVLDRPNHIYTRPEKNAMILNALMVQAVFFNFKFQIPFKQIIKSATILNWYFGAWTQVNHIPCGFVSSA